jgi:uncharacterized membrane protein (DUF2068 family)
VSALACEATARQQRLEAYGVWMARLWAALVMALLLATLLPFAGIQALGELVGRASCALEAIALLAP